MILNKDIETSDKFIEDLARTPIPNILFGVG